MAVSDAQITLAKALLTGEELCRRLTLLTQQASLAQGVPLKELRQRMAASVDLRSWEQVAPIFDRAFGTPYAAVDSSAPLLWSGFVEALDVIDRADRYTELGRALQGIFIAWNAGDDCSSGWPFWAVMVGGLLVIGGVMWLGGRAVE